MSDNPVKALLEKEQCFKVILSTKTEIKCDKEEIKRVIEGIGTGSIIKVRQGLINPSFIVAVVEDTERRLKFVEQVHEIENHNRQDNEYHSGQNQRRLPQGMKSLKDIFAHTELKKLGQGGSDIKSLPKPQ